MCAEHNARIYPTSNKRCLLCLSMIFAAALITLYAHADTANDHLIVAYDNFPPFQWQDEQGKVKGIDIEIIEAVLTDAGFTSSYKKIPWSRQLEIGMKNGDIDIMLSARRTVERKKIAYFSQQSYLPATNMMFIRKEDVATFSGIYTLNDFINKKLRLGMLRHSIYSEEHIALQNNSTFKQHVETVSSDQQLIHMLLSKRIDAFLGMDLGIKFLLKTEDPQQTILPFLYINKNDKHQKGSLFMFSKASMTKSQVDRINTSLNKLLANGAIDKIISPYIVESQKNIEN